MFSSAIKQLDWFHVLLVVMLTLTLNFAKCMFMDLDRITYRITYCTYSINRDCLQLRMHISSSFGVCSRNEVDMDWLKSLHVNTAIVSAEGMV